MKKPLKAKLNNFHHSVELFFENSIEEYSIRGAIVWPESITQTMAVEGMAIIAGQNLQNLQITVFEQFPFFHVDLRIMAGGEMVAGLGPWFNEMLKQYGCRSYFWVGNKMVHRRYRTEIMRAAMIEPKPLFIEIPFAQDKNEGNTLILEKAREKKFLLENDSVIMKQLRMDSPDPRNQYGIQALRVLLAGYEKYPWRMPSQRTTNYNRVAWNW